MEERQRLLFTGEQISCADVPRKRKAARNKMFPKCRERCEPSWYAAGLPAADSTAMTAGNASAGGFRYAMRYSIASSFSVPDCDPTFCASSASGFLPPSANAESESRLVSNAMHILEGKHTMRIQIFTFAPLSSHARLEIGQIEQHLASWVPKVKYHFEDTGEAVMSEPEDVAMDEFVDLARKSRKLGAEMLVVIESDFDNDGDVLYIVAYKHAAEPYWLWLEGAGYEDVASHLSDDDPADDLVAHAAARDLYWNGYRHELRISPADGAGATG